MPRTVIPPAVGKDEQHIPRGAWGDVANDATVIDVVPTIRNTHDRVSDPVIVIFPGGGLECLLLTRCDVSIHIGVATVQVQRGQPVLTIGLPAVAADSCVVRRTRVDMAVIAGLGES